MVKGRLLAVAAVASILLLACETHQLKIERLNPTLDPGKMTSRLKEDLSEARLRGVQFLSPASFAESESFLHEAEKGLERGDIPSEVLLKLSYGLFHLEKAERQARETGALLADILAARDLALAAGVDRGGREFQALDERLGVLIRKAEEGELEKVKRDLGGMEEAYSILELRAIRIKTLKEARDLLAQAEREGVERVLPMTLAAAKEKLKEWDEEVARHRHDPARLQELSTEALFQVNRLHQLMRQARTIEAMKGEEITLWIEGILTKAVVGVSGADRRDKSFEEQIECLLEAVASLRNRHQILSDKLRIQQENLEAMEKELSLRPTDEGTPSRSRSAF